MIVRKRGYAMIEGILIAVGAFVAAWLLLKLLFALGLFLDSKHWL